MSSVETPHQRRRQRHATQVAQLHAPTTEKATAVAKDHWKACFEEIDATKLNIFMDEEDFHIQLHVEFDLQAIAIKLVEAGITLLPAKRSLVDGI